MPDQIQSARIVAKGGMNSNQNHLMLSTEYPGAAVRLLNYETSFHGGYRRINGYTPYDPNFPEVDGYNVGDTAFGAILGVVGFENYQTGNNEIIAVRQKEESEAFLRFYRYDAGLGWWRYVIPLAISEYPTNEVVRARFVTYNDGVLNYLVTAAGPNPLLVFDGVDWGGITSGGAGTGISDAGGDAALDEASIVASFKNYLFAAHDGLVAYSAPGDPFNWTAAAGAGQIPVGFIVQNMHPWRDELYVFGENKIKKIVPVLDGTDTSFVLQDVTNNIGCIAPDSVMEIASNLIFLAPDGIRPVAGTERNNDVELSLISENIQYLVNKFLETNAPLGVVGVPIKQKTQFRYFFSDQNTEQADSRGLLGCFSANDPQRGWEFGETLGIRASCAWSGYLGGVEYVLHGDFNGKVYRQELGSDFDGEDITAIYTTPYLDFGDTQIRKTLRQITSFIRAEGNLEFNLGVRYDWRRSEAINPTDYQEEFTGGASQYGGSGVVYGTGSQYASVAQPVIDTNIEGSGRSVQLSYVSTGTWSPYTIQGFVIDFTVRGRQ